MTTVGSTSALSSCTSSSLRIAIRFAVVKSEGAILDVGTGVKEMQDFFSKLGVEVLHALEGAKLFQHALSDHALVVCWRLSATTMADLV
ncbi:MAG: hypothetical protein EXR98_03695 [Gemmataceae bacterium]|nr:hypothetical protein [Gemmataceae bacterium]